MRALLLCFGLLLAALLALAYLSPGEVPPAPKPAPDVRPEPEPAPTPKPKPRPCP